MLVETHVHTHYSKGSRITHEGLSSPAEMVDDALEKGINALAITDHDSVEGIMEAKRHAKGKDITIIPGAEVSTGDGHILALGISEKVSGGKSAEETVDLIQEQGAIAIAPHPFDITRSGIKTKSLLCDAVEVFNVMNIDRISNHRGYSWAKRHGLVAVAGSDAHCKEMLGLAPLVLPDNCDNIDTILKAIKKGKCTYKTRYAPLSVTIQWIVRRMQLSHDSVMEHIMKSYTGPKRHFYSWLLNSTKHSPGNVDYLYRLLAYIGVGSSVIYSVTRGRRIMEM